MVISIITHCAICRATNFCCSPSSCCSTWPCWHSWPSAMNTSTSHPETTTATGITMPKGTELSLTMKIRLTDLISWVQMKIHRIFIYTNLHTASHFDNEFNFTRIALGQHQVKNLMLFQPCLRDNICDGCGVVAPPTPCLIVIWIWCHCHSCQTSKRVRHAKLYVTCEREPCSSSIIA